MTYVQTDRSCGWVRQQMVAIGLGITQSSIASHRDHPPRVGPS